MNIMANFDVFVCFLFEVWIKIQLRNSRVTVRYPGLEYAKFRIRFHLIRIQGFDDQKLTAEISFFVIKNFKLPILRPIKDVQATEEAFRPYKRTLSTSKHEFSYFSYFCGPFLPSWIRIRIQHNEIRMCALHGPLFQPRWSSCTASVIPATAGPAFSTPSGQITSRSVLVFRIYDILMWIRIPGPMPLTNGSVSGSCYFPHWPSRRQLKTNFLKKFSAYYFLKVHFSKIKSPREVTKQ